MYVIRIETGNAAFGDDLIECTCEVSRILDKLAVDIEAMGVLVNMPLRDSNGNTVGHAGEEEHAPNLPGLLKLALRYLEHPDVTSLPFTVKSMPLAKRIRKALAASEEN